VAHSLMLPFIRRSKLTGSSTNLCHPPIVSKRVVEGRGLSTSTIPKGPFQGRKTHRVGGIVLTHSGSKEREAGLLESPPPSFRASLTVLKRASGK